MKCRRRYLSTNLDERERRRLVSSARYHMGDIRALVLYAVSIFPYQWKICLLVTSHVREDAEGRLPTAFRSCAQYPKESSRSRALLVCIRKTSRASDRHCALTTSQSDHSFLIPLYSFRLTSSRSNGLGSANCT